MTITGNLHPLPHRAPRPQRHKWGDPLRLQFKTERSCIHCGLVKTTRHEPGEYPWIEYYRDLEKIEASGTPGCEVVLADVGLA